MDTLARPDSARATTGATWLITGGEGPEREGSLISADHVSDELTAAGVEHQVVDLSTIDRWSLGAGDRAFLATHGQWGEDGKLQGYLETIRVAYTGSGVLASAVSMHKAASNQAAEALGIRVPRWMRVTHRTRPCDVAQFVDGFGPRVILRPSTGGGSRGVVVAYGFEELCNSLGSSSWTHPDFVLSVYVDGVEVTTAAIERAGDVVCLPVLMTEYDGDFFDYEAKHDPALRLHECPAPIPDATSKAVHDSARRLYADLHLCGFARIDSIVDDDGVAWFLEVNTLPGFSRSGNLATIASAAGLTYRDVVLEQLSSARPVKEYRP